MSLEREIFLTSEERKILFWQIPIPWKKISLIMRLENVLMFQNRAGIAFPDLFIFEFDFSGE